MSIATTEYSATISTDDIYREEDTSRCLSDDLNNIENSIDSLDDNKAAINHSHSDLENAIDQMDSAKAPVSHGHIQSEIVGLPDKLTEIEAAIASLEAGGSSGGSTVTPMLIASMHMGRLDNNNGAELTSSTRICSEAFSVQNGKSYWQVNDKGVNMYVLLYDVDEVFVAYLGSKASGAEIVVNNADAAYMRLSSLIGEYDLTNEFRIYDVDPNSGSGSGGGTTVDAYTKAESDARYAVIAHTHADYASTDHTHSELHTHDNKNVLDAITAAKVAAWDAGTGSDSGSSVDAYTKTESDARYAAAAHTHTEYMSENTANATFATINHAHDGYAATNHAHSYNDLMDLPAEQTPYVHPTTHPATMITGLADVATSGSYNDLSGRPTSLPANGGDASTLGGLSSSAFARTTHTHSDYLSTGGGTVNGNLNVTGIFRVNGQQSVYDSGTMITLSTNNRQTMIAGSQVYSKTTITVSSDERLKENIRSVDAEKCAEFIKGIDVKAFNYIGNATPCIGVIAQDIQDTELGEFFVFVQPGEEGYLAVKAADLVFPLISTVQQLSAEVEMLKSKI